MRITKSSTLLFFSVCLAIQSVQATDESVYFAFDDHTIPWRENLQLTLVQPEKHPDNPVVPRGGKGSVDEWAVQFYGSVLQHEGKFKMWYIAADNQSLELIKKGKGFSGLRPAYAESEDGIHWQKPNLDLVEHNGSKANNLVAMNPPETSGIHLIVIHEQDEPDASRRFKMLLTVSAMLGESKGSSSVTLFSADGLTWHSPTPLHFDEGFLRAEDLIMPPTNFEQGGLFRWKGMYHLPGQQFSPSVTQIDGKTVGRMMMTFRSRDLISWESASAPGFIRGTAVGRVGTPHTDEEAHLASSIWNRGNVLLGVYGIWHGAENWQERSIELGLMLSNDGIHFREPIRDYVLIPRGEEGEWDQGGLLQGQGFANVGDNSYIYYGAWDLNKPSYPPRGGVGLVTMRRDGFGYLAQQKTNAPAKFETSSFQPHEGGTRLFVNVDQVSESAPLIVELLDAESRPVPGYSGKQAGRVSEPGIHQEVTWPATQTSVIDIKEACSVRVSLSPDGDARFYALYVAQPDA